MSLELSASLKFIKKAVLLCKPHGSKFGKKVGACGPENMANKILYMCVSVLPLKQVTNCYFHNFINFKSHIFTFAMNIKSLAVT